MLAFNELPPHRVVPLIPQSAVDTRVMELAEEIKNTSNGLSIVLLGALTGAGKFAWNLGQSLWGLGMQDVLVDFMAVESYGSGTQSNRMPKITKIPKLSVQNLDVHLLEDIVDSGYSMRALHETLLSLGARSVRTVSLLWKEEAQEVDVAINHIGFRIPKEFVVGSGIDWKEYYRFYPGIGVVEFE
jgi:hypoxanthine phosphoribosyltransferase